MKRFYKAIIATMLTTSMLAAAEDDQKKCPRKFELEGGLLVWKVRASNSAYALQSSNDFFLATPNVVSPRNVNFDFDVGFRLGAGYTTDNDMWKVALQYSYLNPKESDSKTVASPSELQPAWGLK